jgi:hypothetical protein
MRTSAWVASRFRPVERQMLCAIRHCELSLLTAPFRMTSYQSEQRAGMPGNH